jgi:hypothetical protein
MYTDPGIWSMIVAGIVAIGLTPLYIFRTKLKELWNKITKKDKADAGK